MSGIWDSGSIGFIVFDESQLIPVAIDGLPVENSDRTLADSENEPAFFMPENDDENFVEKGKENEFDSQEDNGYNEIIKKDVLNQSEKTKLKLKTGWSDEIIDYIRSMEEARIYIDADLKETEINRRKCLNRSDIDWEQRDEDGITNQERIKKGMAPYAKNGEKIELHHIGQRHDSPLAELKKSEHRGKENYTILHNKQKQSEIERSIFDYEREEYWKSRDSMKGDNNE